MLDIERVIDDTVELGADLRAVAGADGLDQ